MSTIGMDLNDLDEEFGDAKAPDKGIVDLPPGRYEVMITDASLDHTKTGRRVLRLPFEVLAPEEHAGARNSCFRLLESGVLGWLKRDLEILGMAGMQPSELPSQLTRFRGIKVEVSASAKGDRVYYYLNKRIGRSARDASHAGKAEVPF